MKRRLKNSDVSENSDESVDRSESSSNELEERQHLSLEKRRQDEVDALQGHFDVKLSVDQLQQIKTGSMEAFLKSIYLKTNPNQNHCLFSVAAVHDRADIMKFMIDNFYIKPLAEDTPNGFREAISKASALPSLNALKYSLSILHDTLCDEYEDLNRASLEASMIIAESDIGYNPNSYRASDPIYKALEDRHYHAAYYFYTYYVKSYLDPTNMLLDRCREYFFEQSEVSQVCNEFFAYGFFISSCLSPMCTQNLWVLLEISKESKKNDFAQHPEMLEILLCLDYTAKGDFASNILTHFLNHKVSYNPYLLSPIGYQNFELQNCTPSNEAREFLDLVANASMTEGLLRM